MKRRDIFRVPARVQRRISPEIVWKDANGNEKRQPAVDKGWFVIVTLGDTDYAFSYGDEKPLITESPITLVLEYTVPEE